MRKRAVSMILTGIMAMSGLAMIYADDKTCEEINVNTVSEKIEVCGEKLNDNFKINVSKDGIIEIKLEENATTGYAWHIEIEDKETLKVISDEYVNVEIKDGQIPMCGAPEVRVWKIKALKDGNTNIKFKLYREWNPEEIQGIKNFEVKISEEGKSEVFINPYLEDENLQEIFEVYENTDENSGLLLAPSK